MATSNDRPGTGDKPVTDAGADASQTRSRRGTWLGDRLSSLTTPASDQGSTSANAVEGGTTVPSSSRTSGANRGNAERSQGGKGVSRTSGESRTAGPARSGSVSRGTAGGAGSGSGSRGTASSSPRGTTSSSRGGGGAPRGKGSGNGPRRIRLTLARLDPFSVMKLSFVIAIAFGIATVVCVAVLWSLVDSMGLLDKLNQLGSDLNNNKPLPFMEYFKFSKMISYATIVSFINVVIITALGTLFAFLYNIVAGLLGGLKMTFTDE